MHEHSSGTNDGNYHPRHRQTLLPLNVLHEIIGKHHSNTSVPHRKDTIVCPGNGSGLWRAMKLVKAHTRAVALAPRRCKNTARSIVIVNMFTGVLLISLQSIIALRPRQVFIQLNGIYTHLLARVDVICSKVMIYVICNCFDLYLTLLHRNCTGNSKCRMCGFAGQYFDNQGEVRMPQQVSAFVSV